ncbi:FMN-binding negative transcriptional regulator [Chitinasiproducens palmae]|uniref:Negative transcriptional regulator, PaiB family n=1 Tax=Chitinasiproducens palmae TaxID=1770053 RepID=A0A1H2PPM1_9BURK|nr:FMN-binding negative transcriptional regulator [Chitinasiproducens palmae]SDV48723.1 negative transcriptional regulator, PaiB family [Chitinasiproducens palmae]
MYVPTMFAEDRPEILHRLIRDNPLGVLVTHGAGGLEANHLPFLLDERHDTGPLLLAHVARANPVWRELADGAEVMVIFRGAHGYISPSWYPSKHETHRHVPTWNYEVVHAHGRLRIRDDEKFLRGVLAKLTRTHEASEARPWKMGDAPSDFLDTLIGQIVGIAVEVTRFEGKRKLSQNRDARDFSGVVGSLQERGNDTLAATMAALDERPR